MIVETLAKQYWETKKELDAVRNRLDGIEAQLFTEMTKANLREGNKIKFEGVHFKVKITDRNNINVDQKKAAMIPYPVWRIKRELDMNAYKELDGMAKEMVDEAITIKPGKPNFEVEVI